MFKLFLALGSVNAFLAIALGAFGAHGLKNKLTADMLAVYQTGVQYHMYHALALILIALVSDKVGTASYVQWSGWLMIIGIVLFSGALYTLSISGVKTLGAVAPLGGLAFLAGWLLLLFAVWKSA
jgi:uncharacterized membrane protein YgdD (TMEM256/DUF423 family)